MERRCSKPRRPRHDLDRAFARALSSGPQHARSPGQLEQAETKVNEILGLDQTEDEKIRRIRKWFAYYHLLDVTTMLELAIWKCNNGTGEDAAARQSSRSNSGSDMNVIIPGVLDCLDLGV